ncbi:MAG: GNAT family N-acetyltransferase [Anaerolineaceae bacterium]|jgi:ribosomal protein S18 acetylase RimI-like enzyme
MTEKVHEEISPSDLAKVSIRRMTREDLPALEWNGEFKHFRNVYKSVYHRMQQGGADAWVAESAQGEIIGQVFLQYMSDRPELADGWNRAYLYSFRIKPLYRSRGLGTRMLRVLEDALIARHYHHVTLNVARDNPDAIRLYKRQGFQIIAEEPGIWSYIDHEGQWQTVIEPSWRMEKKLA